jgi:hypothetical protein
MGSWCTDEIGESSLPVFVSFIPGVMHRPGLVLNLLLGAGLRTKWAREELAPDAEDDDIEDILCQRLRTMK